MNRIDRIRKKITKARKGENTKECCAVVGRLTADGGALSVSSSCRSCQSCLTPSARRGRPVACSAFVAFVPSWFQFFSPGETESIAEI